MLRKLVNLLGYKARKNLINSIAHVRLTLWPPKNIKFAVHEKGASFPIESREEVRDILKPGDILRRRINGFLANDLIGGRFPHVAIYVGSSTSGGLDQAIVHAIGRGVSIEHVDAFFAVADEVDVWRPSKPLHHKRVDTVCKRAKNAYNRRVKYDYDFLSDISEKHPEVNIDEFDERFYCGELVAFAYRPYLSKELSFNVGKRFGEAAYVPSTMVPGVGFHRVWPQDGTT